MKLAKVIGVAALCAASLAVTTDPASATLITSMSDGLVIGMPEVEYVGQGSQELASGVTWSSTASGSVFGYSGIYGFTSNGLWLGMNMAGLNSAAGSMTFAFDTPVDGVGGYLNYAPQTGATPTIAVYDSAMNLLEISTLSFSTGGGRNKGHFFGFQSDDISFFTLSGSFIGITDLTVSRDLVQSLDYPQGGEILPLGPQGGQAAPVPEPSSFLLFGAGLLGLGLLRKRRAQGWD